MSERPEALAMRFADVSDAVIVFVAKCPDHRWFAVTQAEGWTVAAVCRHIARGFEVHPQLIAQAATGQSFPTDYTWEAVHASNAEQARAWAYLSRADVLAELRRQRAAALVVLRSLSDADLAQHRWWPLLDAESAPLVQLVHGMIDHPGLHLPSLYATTGFR